MGGLVDRREICTRKTGSSETLRAKLWRRNFALKMVRIPLVLVAGKQASSMGAFYYLCCNSKANRQLSLL